MKKSKFLLVFLMATLFVGFTACSDDDDDIKELKLEKNAVEVQLDSTFAVGITEGNGDYNAKPADDKIADATIKDNVVTIKGKAVGSTNVTITDKEGKSSVIAVTVISIAGEWKEGKESLDVEAKNAEAVAKIKEEFKGTGVKTLTLKDDASFAAVYAGAEGEDDNTKEGTYTYKDGVLTLTFKVEEGAEAKIEAYKVIEVTKTGLKLEVNKTEGYKEVYPDDAVTKAIESTSFTR